MSLLIPLSLSFARYSPRTLRANDAVVSCDAWRAEQRDQSRDGRALATEGEADQRHQHQRHADDPLFAPPRARTPLSDRVSPVDDGAGRGPAVLGPWDQDLSPVRMPPDCRGTS